MSEHRNHNLVRPMSSEVCGVGDEEHVDEEEVTVPNDGRRHDHAGSEDEEKEDGVGPEAQQPTRRSPPSKPTAAELSAHRVSHLPFRDWCPECVAGRAKGAMASEKRLLKGNACALKWGCKLIYYLYLLHHGRNNQIH